MRLLDALDRASPLSLQDRHAALEEFGYIDAYNLPNDLDIRRAIQSWEEIFKDMPYPAHLVDFVQRVHTWNTPAIPLFGGTPQEIGEVTLFDLMFGIDERRTYTMSNGDDVIPLTVRQIWNNAQLSLGQEWSDRYIERARQQYPDFAKLYDSVSESEVEILDLTGTGPAIFKDKSGRTLTLRIIGADLVSDPRFRSVQMVPLDAETARLISTPRQ